MSLQKQPEAAQFVRAFTGSNRNILDYLLEEIPQHQPAEQQSFLLQTSILDRLSGGVCEAVTGRIDSQTILEELDRANLFIIPLDEDRRWYRYHRLFGDLPRQMRRELGCRFVATGAVEQIDDICWLTQCEVEQTVAQIDSHPHKSPAWA